MDQHRIAFLGSGGIARAHAYALAALPYYYDQAPDLARSVVASRTAERREAFARRFGFAEAIEPDALWSREDIDAVFILGPNDTHFEHLERALAMPAVSHVYVEKPVCATREEEEALARRLPEIPAQTEVRAGFQFLQMSNVRRALEHWSGGGFGTPVHFQLRYLHSGYLDIAYREKRRSRLQPAPAGGAVADLGSHVLSMAVAFLGPDLEVVAARSGGSFPDVQAESDLCTLMLLEDRAHGAAGTVTASRISAGTGDQLEVEVRGTEGALRLTTERPDHLEVYRRSSGWRLENCGNDFSPATAYPARYVPAGWLRSLIHAHYLFFGGEDAAAFVAGLEHALTVQRLIRRCAEINRPAGASG